MIANCEKRANDIRELKDFLFELENKILAATYLANRLIDDDTKELSLVKLATYIEIAGVSCSRAIEIAENSFAETD